MRRNWSERLKGKLRPPVYRVFARGKPVFDCPICGYRGPFKDKRVSRHPDVVRAHSKCVRCGASERHRMQSLVIDELFGNRDGSGKRLLHVAPEFCLQPRLSSLFEIYHTMDLFRTDVDFVEDIQKMTFADGSYDCVYVSRVMTSVPDMEAATRECRRILAPGGMAVISEAYIHEQTREFAPSTARRPREVGLDALDLFARHFSRVERFLADRYPSRHQLLNRMRIDGQPADDFPTAVRVPGEGYMELVAVCYV